jgi:hypothetical protein
MCVASDKHVACCSGVSLVCVGLGAVFASEEWGVVWGVTLVADIAGIVVIMHL